MFYRKVILTAEVFIVFLPVAVFAGTIQLPQTGQTKCYSYPWTTIPCAGTGQDGEIQAGVPWPDPRFAVTYCDANAPCANQSTDCDTNPSTDVVMDKLTGLMWSRNGKITDWASWNGAIHYANNLTLCGYSDWRLPNINEIESLINADEPHIPTWLNTQGFYNMQSMNHYWSSTAYAFAPYRAFSLSSGVIEIELVNKDFYPSNSLIPGFVLPVRSGEIAGVVNLPETGQTKCNNEMGVEIPCAGTGQDGDIRAGVTWPNPRFTDNFDGTVTDNLTGLVWLKNANCIKTNYSSFDNDYTYGDGGVTWQHGLNFVKGINNGTYSQCGAGYSDWRLPNIKELRSLIDYSRYNPALSASHPFTNLSGWGSTYWSSTSYPYNGGVAWVVYMAIGDVFKYDMNNYGFYIWPVRSGQVGGSFDYYCDKDNDGYLSSLISGTCTGSGCVLVGCQTTPGNDCNDNDPAIHPGASDTNCNGIDEDCNGTPDDGYVPMPTSCGIGACASTGQLICSSGTLVDTCNPGTPQTEGPYGNPTCSDLKDNDCDGLTDALDPSCFPPDLLVSSWTAPANACAGATVSIKDTTKNQGTGTAGASQTCFYFSTNTTLDAGDTPLGCRAIPSLGAGAVNTGTTPVTLPNVSIGKYYLITMADDGKVVAESNETNNKKSKVIYIGPDLIVSALTAPTSATRGTTILIGDTTKNKGCGIAGASTTKFYLSTNTTINIGVDYELGVRSVPALGTNAISTGTTSVVIPAGILTGKYYIITNSDDANVVVEGNETNNKKTKAITIQ